MLDFIFNVQKISDIKKILTCVPIPKMKEFLKKYKPQDTPKEYTRLNYVHSRFEAEAKIKRQAIDKGLARIKDKLVQEQELNRFVIDRFGTGLSAAGDSLYASTKLLSPKPLSEEWYIKDIQSLQNEAHIKDLIDKTVTLKVTSMYNFIEDVVKFTVFLETNNITVKSFIESDVSKFITTLRRGVDDGRIKTDL